MWRLAYRRNSLAKKQGNLGSGHNTRSEFQTGHAHARPALSTIVENGKALLAVSCRCRHCRQSYFSESHWTSRESAWFIAGSIRLSDDLSETQAQTAELPSSTRWSQIPPSHHAEQRKQKETPATPTLCFPLPSLHDLGLSAEFTALACQVQVAGVLARWTRP